MMHETKLSHFNDVMSEYTDGECGGRLTPDISLESKVLQSGVTDKYSIMYLHEFFRAGGGMMLIHETKQPDIGNFLPDC